MIRVTNTVAIDENDIELSFIRASGPGGQNVNKVATAVQLRFDLAAARLPQAVRERAMKMAGSRLTNDGEIVITTQKYRSQERNRQHAIEQLVALLQEATKQPKKRRKTKPTRASKERRLDKKRRRSETKRGRGRISDY